MKAVFPYTCQENTPVYCSGPELYTALKLGAQITIHNAYRANVLHDENGNIVYPYRTLVKSLVTAHNESELKYGKKSVEYKFLKLMINSLYGKIAQNVAKMHKNFDEARKYDDVESPITNNVYAIFKQKIKASLW